MEVAAALFQLPPHHEEYLSSLWTPNEISCAFSVWFESYYYEFSMYRQMRSTDPSWENAITDHTASMVEFLQRTKFNLPCIPTHQS